MKFFLKIKWLTNYPHGYIIGHVIDLPHIQSVGNMIQSRTRFRLFYFLTNIPV